MTTKDTPKPAEVSGRALVDIPQLGLRSGQYATLSADDYSANCDESNFDTAAVDPDAVAP